MPLPSSIHPTTALMVRGADARTFMQGQLTSDVRRVTQHQAVWGALCTGQGRIQALLALASHAEGLLALVPTELADGVISRWGGFTLSSKVTFEQLPSLAVPVTEAEARQLTGDDLPVEPGACRSNETLTVVRWWGSPERYLGVGPRDRLPQLTVTEQADRARAWRRADVDAGIPSVFLETRGLFVPQTLNLDLLGGVSFDKGCYVGQEVVARARRGGVPRRLFGFWAECAPPAPGALVLFEGREVGHVVDAVGSSRGSELLAVVDLELAQSRLQVRGHAGSTLVPRPLSYEVPTERR